MLREVTIVNRLLHNVHIEEPDVTKVNRLLYAGSYIVCERLGVLEKRKNVKQTNKPWWQRRLEGSISQWRKDLGRISELKKGGKLKERVMNELKKDTKF